MASIFYPSSASVYTRIVGGTDLTEISITVNPDVVFVFNPNTSFPYTASIVSASYAVSASFAENGGSGGGGGASIIETRMFS